MASGSGGVSALAPTPSLVDLPKPWLVRLASCSSFDEDSATLVALFRTCTFFRDTVQQQRKAWLHFFVPIAPENFPGEVDRLCTLAKGSNNVRLEFARHQGAGAPQPWTQTEPHITHLLVCAMAQLGALQLTGVREVKLQGLEQTALVPTWLPVLCPNVTGLHMKESAITRHLLRSAPAPALAAPPPPPTSPIHAPLPPALPPPPVPVLQARQGLQHITWWPHAKQNMPPPLAQHVRQQLAALPSLCHLSLKDTRGLVEAEHSTNVTQLHFWSRAAFSEEAALLQRLPVQFPSLRVLEATDCIKVDDRGLEALLTMPSLRGVSVQGFSLQRSHTHRTCAWTQLGVAELHVDSFARLPLDSMQRCSFMLWGVAVPTVHAHAVQRVAAAVARWRGQCTAGRLGISGCDPAALLTTLQPLLSALPEAQQQEVNVWGLQDATPLVLQRLGEHLPVSVTKLVLGYCTLAPEAWPALLPSLPASVQELQLRRMGPSVEQVMGMCGSAVRSIRVTVQGHVNMEGVKQRVEIRLAEQQHQQLVVLAWQQ